MASTTGRLPRLWNGGVNSQGRVRRAASSFASIAWLGWRRLLKILARLALSTTARWAFVDLQDAKAPASTSLGTSSLRDEGKFQFRLNVPRKGDRKSYWPIPACTQATTSCSGSLPPGGSPSGDRAPRPWRPEYRWRRAGRHRERSLPRPAPGPPGTQRRAAPPRSGLRRRPTTSPLLL